MTQVSENRGFRRAVKITASIGIIFILTVVFYPTAPCWNSKSPLAKKTAAYIMAYRKDLIGLEKKEVIQRIGEPSRRSDRYALLVLPRVSRPSVGMTSDVVIHIDESNQVTGVTYAWKDYVPARTQQFDAARWKHGNDDAKILMASDFISRWRTGELREKYHHLDLIEKDLGKVLFVDEWRYLIADWEALILDFGPNGKVRGTEIGYDD